MQIEYDDQIKRSTFYHNHFIIWRQINHWQMGV
jgi:hypothetical protein